MSMTGLECLLPAASWPLLSEPGLLTCSLGLTTTLLAAQLSMPFSWRLEISYETL